jgi:hypothetical protein
VGVGTLLVERKQAFKGDALLESFDAFMKLFCVR